ncbi:hypothetical protein [Streptomyces durbertensis]|uniref:hypothetical protein n=1 Tax=Streptomyces durbertensis TaxID=2448886 RepID=UPI001E477BDD|nr:hypothetical protein [Streptomyces durbertensis]
MSDPVSRVMLLFDIERYSDRDDVEQAYLRRMLYDVADRTLAAAGVEETAHRRADRGDGLIELLDADTSLPALLRALLTETPVLLRAVNRMASSSAQIRLRAVLATGYVAVDGLDGWVGSDLNHAARLLDSAELRAALRERADDFALCVSTGVYEGIVRHGYPGVPPEDFTAVTPDSKNGRLRAWLHGPGPRASRGNARGPATDTATGGTPDGGDPAGGGTTGGGTAAGARTAHAQTAPAPAGGSQPGGVPAAGRGGASFTFHGNPSFGGDLVGGDKRTFEGAVVEGDVHLGAGRRAQSRRPRRETPRRSETHDTHDTPRTNQEEA